MGLLPGSNSPTDKDPELLSGLQSNWEILQRRSKDVGGETVTRGPGNDTLMFLLGTEAPTSRYHGIIRAAPSHGNGSM